jgi:hypothetical protein
MSRTLACLTALLTAASVATAQQPGEPTPLTLSPAAVVSPTSTYRLLPQGRDLTPGNAAALYYRSLAVFAENRTLLEELNSGQWEKWLGMPLAELPLDQVAGKLEAFDGVFRELDQAACRRQCDWQLSDRSEGAALILPEVQKSRQLIQVLGVRVRYHVARARYPEAVRALATGYALARRMGQGPSLIHVLVGAALAYILDARLEELIAQPGAPNLYWALTVLPRPFIDPLPAIDEEDLMVERTWPGLRRLEEGPLTAKQVAEIREGFRRVFRDFGFKEPSVLDEAAQAWEQAQTLPRARKALLAEGFTAEQLDAMQPFQVVAVYCLREYRRTLDDFTAWFRVPDFAREPGYQRARDRMHGAGLQLEQLVLHPRRVLSNNAFLGAPAFDKAFLAVGRVDRRFAALRCVEAIRLHAAAHDGKLPASLKEVTEVPLPADPITHKPFAYEVHGDKARLAAPLQNGAKTPPYERLAYEIALRH